MSREKGMSRGRRPRTDAQVTTLRREFETLASEVRRQEKELRRIGKLSAEQAKRQGAIADLLELGDPPKAGDRGVVRELQDSIVRVEDYLLKTAERIENILTALKQHRELLAKVNKRLLDMGARDRIRLELDVMKNTLSILALSGVEIDAALVKDIDKLRASIRESADLVQLERAKADLDKKFDGELKRFDLDAIWSKKKEIPGYG